MRFERSRKNKTIGQLLRVVEERSGDEKCILAAEELASRVRALEAKLIRIQKCFPLAGRVK